MNGKADFNNFNLLLVSTFIVDDYKFSGPIMNHPNSRMVL